MGLQDHIIETRILKKTNTSGHVTCLARLWAAQGPCSEQPGDQAREFQECAAMSPIARGSTYSAVLCDHVVVVGDNMQVVQALQKGDLLAEGVRLSRVLALQHLHRHQRPMPARLVHLRSTRGSA